MVGPVMGSMIYSSLGYENTFFVFSGILLVSFVIVFFILPNRLNKLDEQLESEATDQERNSQVAPEKEISFKMFIFNARAMLAVFSSMIAMIFMLFYNGILSVHLEKNMGVSQDNIGNLYF
jgi:uncharacterized membrane protein